MQEFLLLHTYSSGGTAAIDVDLMKVRSFILVICTLTVDSITVTDGGSGYTSTPDVTLSAPTGPNGRTATARATVVNGVVTEITIISGGTHMSQHQQLLLCQHQIQVLQHLQLQKCFQLTIQ